MAAAATSLCCRARPVVFLLPRAGLPAAARRSSSCRAQAFFLLPPAWLPAAARAQAFLLPRAPGVFLLPRAERCPVVFLLPHAPGLPSTRPSSSICWPPNDRPSLCWFAQPDHLSAGPGGQIWPEQPWPPPSAQLPLLLPLRSSLSLCLFLVDCKLIHFLLIGNQIDCTKKEFISVLVLKL
jgi:hypothetical protein